MKKKYLRSIGTTSVWIRRGDFLGFSWKKLWNFGSTLRLVAEKDSETMMRRYLKRNSNIQAKQTPVLLLHRTQFFDAQSSLLSLHCHRLEGQPFFKRKWGHRNTRMSMSLCGRSGLERFFAARSRSRWAPADDARMGKQLRPSPRRRRLHGSADGDGEIAGLGWTVFRRVSWLSSDQTEKSVARGPDRGVEMMRLQASFGRNRCSKSVCWWVVTEQPYLF